MRQMTWRSRAGSDRESKADFYLASAYYVSLPDVIDNMRITAYNSGIMTARNQSREAGRPEVQRPSTEGTASPSRDEGPDPLGEARRAANGILAAWALRELVALRTSKPTDG